MLRRSTGSARLAGPVGAAVLLAACLVLAAAPHAGAAGERHVPQFDLLVRPTVVSKLPLELRLGFEGFGKHPNKHGREVRVGRVRLDEGTVTAVGNHRWICSHYTAAAEPSFSGHGGCAPFGQVRTDGLVDICTEEGGTLRIDGLVPNGVEAIELDRDGRGPTQTIPVTRNAFTAVPPRTDLTFRALDASGEAVIEHSYPLGHLAPLGGGGGCYAFFEARAEAPDG